MTGTFEKIVKTVEEHKAIWLKLQSQKKKLNDIYLTATDQEKDILFKKIDKTKKQLKKSFKNL
jgi:hypothetical protein